MKFRYEIIKNLIMVIFCVMFLCSCGAEDEIVMDLSGSQPSDETVVQPDEGMPVIYEGNIPEDGGFATEIPETGTTPGILYVYMCGAVANPGVYQLREGSRLYEAVEMAGGLTEDADETCFNLARQLSDGEQIVVLTHEETARLMEEGKYIPGQGNADAAVQTPDTSSGLVNINTASVSELTTVSGIGESRAQAIIAYREKNGGFRCIEDIKKVDGIKDGLFFRIKDQITV